MYEIKIKVNGNGTLNTGFVERLKLGTHNEVNRVKLSFEVDETIEGSYHYVKFLKDDTSLIYRINSNDQFIVNKTILTSPGIWQVSFISTDSGLSNQKITGSYAYISEPIEVIVMEGILQSGNVPEEWDALQSLCLMTMDYVFIPGSVKSVGDYFYYDSRRTFDLRIGSGVESLGKYTFYKAVIPKLSFDSNSTLTTLNDYALYNLSIENEVVIPASVKFWGKYVLGYTSTPSISFERNSKLEELGSYAFWYSDYTKIVLPDKLKTLGDRTYVFSHCQYLEYIWIPNTLTSTVPANLSNECPLVTTIELQNGFNVSANFTSFPNLSAESLVKMINALKDLNGSSAKSLTIGETNLAKLTSEQIAIATNKNWTLS